MQQCNNFYISEVYSEAALAGLSPKSRVLTDLTGHNPGLVHMCTFVI